MRPYIHEDCQYAVVGGKILGDIVVDPSDGCGLNALPSLSLLLSALCGLPALGGETEIVFADAAAGKALLSERDDFTKALSPFDRQARMRVAAPLSAEKFREFIGEAAIEWPADERRLLEASWGRVMKKLGALGAATPDENVTVIRTDGSEDSGAAYTRGNSIIFHPGSVVAGKRLDGLVAHELFHVISRHDAKLRDQLYAIIGFEPCGEIVLPKSLAERKLTNPDAPFNRHAIRVEVGGKPARVVPILVAARPFDPEGKDDLLSYLSLQFLMIEKQEGRWMAKADKGGDPVIVSPIRMKNFSEQIGRNTGYIIHPEEILAENFRHLVLGRKKLPDPEILEKMRKVFAAVAKDAR